MITRFLKRVLNIDTVNADLKKYGSYVKMIKRSDLGEIFYNSHLGMRYESTSPQGKYNLNVVFLKDSVVITVWSK